MRRLVPLAVAATALTGLAVIPTQAQAASTPKCLSRKATVVIGSNNKVTSGKAVLVNHPSETYLEVRWDDVVLIKGDHNRLHVLEPGLNSLGGKSFVCANGSHNELWGTFFRAYSKPGHDNTVTHHDDPCSLPFDPRFYNFAQVDVQDCQD